jgi:hypothetical protein
VHTCWPTYYKEREECKPEVSMTIGMFFSRANRKTFSSLRAIPSGLICMHTIAQAILIMMCGKEIKKAVTHNKHLLFYSRNYRSRTNDQPI